MVIDFDATLIPFTLYRLSTGELLRHLAGSSVVVFDAQCDPQISPDTGWVFGHHDPATHHVVDGEAQPKSISD